MAETDDIQAWLDGLGLGQYAELFADNAIDADVLGDLTEDDLEKLGVLLGHRKKIMRAIATGDAPAAATAPAQPDGAATAAPAGPERRQLTVMFCDLVGSTALSERLDPEDLRELFGAYQDLCTRVVERFDGHVAKFMGDGVLAYFGYPQAHEGDAERAVLAGLDIVAGLGELNAGVGLRHDIELAVRIGIATGLVVVGDIVGETPNLAARLQELAPANGIVVASGTRALIGDLFELEDLGAHAIKGFDVAVALWRVVRPAATTSRFEAVRTRGPTRLIGREHEIGLLRERWQRATDGEGQVVYLSGEAGIGKSRITESLYEEIAGDDPIRLRFQCSPYYANSPLYPIATQLEHAAGFALDDTPPKNSTRSRPCWRRRPTMSQISRR